MSWIEINLFGGRWKEFFLDGTMMSMSRLCTFIAIIALVVAMFWSLASGAYAVFTTINSAEAVRAAFDAATEFGFMVCGLGGFNYAMNRTAGAYETVRKAQAEAGIQPPTPPAAPSPINLNVNPSTTPASAKDLAIEVAGDMNVKPTERS